jgi:hypothetical protein
MHQLALESLLTPNKNIQNCEAVKSQDSQHYMQSFNNKVNPLK